MLRQSGGDGPIAAAASSINEQLRASRSRHRPWIIACLGALRVHRNGEAILFSAPHLPLSWPMPAAEGQRAADAVWQAYLQWTLGDASASVHLEDTILGLSPTALRAGPDDNPEPWWANELLILHALQSFVLLSARLDLWPAIERCVAYHVAEIQPDHATNEPWAVHALGLHADGNITAETLLHAAFVQGAGGLTPVAQLVVADALYALEKGTLPV